MEIASAGRFWKRLLWGTLICAFSNSGAVAGIFQLESDRLAVVGELEYVTTRHEDTLLDVARLYDLGYEEIRLANPGVDPWLPGEGTRILLPLLFVLPQAPYKDIVINLAEKRLYYFPPKKPGEPREVVTHPISIGREGWETPIGVTQIVRKDKDPKWIPPPSIKKEHEEKGDPLPDVVPAGPDNPLGQYALRLGFSGYLIHGTNKPYGIGMEVSHGCIRLAPEDIESLFAEVKIGTRVQIVDQPFKAGWRRGKLYLEVHPKFDHGKKDAGWFDLSKMVQVLVDATKGMEDEVEVDWDEAKRVAEQANGVPAVVGWRRDGEERQGGEEPADIEEDDQKYSFPPTDGSLPVLPEWMRR